jgi:hypothetical protein
MTTDLQRELEETEARASKLRRMIAAAPCAEVGHRWVFRGGAWCGCNVDGAPGSCSVPVHTCSVCGDCDYGDNEEADGIRADCYCAELVPNPDREQDVNET